MSAIDVIKRRLKKERVPDARDPDEIDRNRDGHVTIREAVGADASQSS